MCAICTTMGWPCPDCYPKNCLKLSWDKSEAVSAVGGEAGSPGQILNIFFKRKRKQRAVGVSLHSVIAFTPSLVGKLQWDEDQDTAVLGQKQNWLCYEQPYPSRLDSALNLRNCEGGESHACISVPAVACMSSSKMFGVFFCKTDIKSTFFCDLFSQSVLFKKQDVCVSQVEELRLGQQLGSPSSHQAALQLCIPAVLTAQPAPEEQSLHFCIKWDTVGCVVFQIWSHNFFFN